MITIRLMGTPEEVATRAACMGALVEGLKTSPDDPNRGHARLVRQYLRVRVWVGLDGTVEDSAYDTLEDLEREGITFGRGVMPWAR